MYGRSLNAFFGVNLDALKTPSSEELNLSRFSFDPKVVDMIQEVWEKLRRTDRRSREKMEESLAMLECLPHEQQLAVLETTIQRAFHINYLRTVADSYRKKLPPKEEQPTRRPSPPPSPESATAPVAASAAGSIDRSSEEELQQQQKVDGWTAVTLKTLTFHSEDECTECDVSQPSNRVIRLVGDASRFLEVKFDPPTKKKDWTRKEWIQLVKSKMMHGIHHGGKQYVQQSADLC